MEGRIMNIDPEILCGTPVFFGTRVPVKNLFDCLESGKSIDYFLDDFEGVKREQVMKILKMSQKLLETSSNIFREPPKTMKFEADEQVKSGVYCGK